MLEQAVAAYREALKERTRERVPLDWAMTQLALGTALRALGEREPGIERLTEARLAIDTACAVFREAGDSYHTRICEKNHKLLERLVAARASVRTQR